MTSARRAARGASAARSTQDPSAELLAGPCVEVWASCDDTRSESPFNGTWWRARRAWRAACDRWAAENGVQAWTLFNRARARRPWSRDWLLGHGHRQWVDWLEGRSDARPEGVLPSDWNSKL